MNSAQQGPSDGLMTASRQFRLGSGIFWLSVLTGCAIALGNPYNLNLWLQFVCLGIGLRFLLFRRKADLLAGALVVGATILSFLAGNINMIAYQFVHGQNQAGLARDYKQLELYALKPIELVLPPWQHRLACFSDISRRYLGAAWVKGEVFSPYLGVVGLSAMVWLVVELGLRVPNLCKVPRRLPSYGPLCLWVMLYSAIGGVNCFLGLLFGLTHFRGSNRFSIFISALCLLFLVSRMSRVVRHWNRFASYALAVSVATLGLLDQLPLPNPNEAETALQRLESDRAFGRALEERLPRGAMIFQLPIMGFPEADPVRGCDVYDHLRPYLWTKALCFSFGSVKGRPREGWQNQVGVLPPGQLIKELERYDFAGLYFNRKAYEDRAEGMLKELAKCGKSQLIEDEGRDRVCVLLNPSSRPAWPHSDDAALIVYKGDWTMGMFSHNSFGDYLGHWACSSRSLLYFMNDHPESCDFHLTGWVAVMSPRQVDIRFEGKIIWNEPLAAGEGRPLDLRLCARPGRNYLYFESDRKPEPPPDKPHGIRVVQGIPDLQIVRDSPPGQ